MNTGKMKARGGRSLGSGTNADPTKIRSALVFQSTEKVSLFRDSENLVSKVEHRVGLEVIE